MSENDGTTPTAPVHGADVRENSAFEALRREAKRLLKQARTGDAVLLARLRQLLPRLESQSDEAIRAELKLADVQHAIARQQGRSSWQELKQLVLAVDPIHVQAARFLLAVRDEDVTGAEQQLAAHPALASHDIYTACAVGNTNAVRAFIAADLQSATRASVPDGTQPVIYACHSGLSMRLGVSAQDREALVAMLLDAGASPNAFRQLDGDEHARIPALYFACVSGNVPVVRLLLERGASPNDGESVYHAAERDQRDCLELLLAHGADLSGSHEHWGNTPLYFLAGYKEFSPLCASATRGMQWLLEHGADPNVASLVVPGPYAKTPVAETPLHRIAAYGRNDTVASMLVEHGASIDLPRADGRSAYALAVRTGNQRVAEYLAGIGADTSLTPVDQLLGALASANEAEARAVVATNAGILGDLTDEDRQALALAVEEGRESSVRLMLSLGWDIADEGAWGGSPLHHAAWHGRPDMVRLLLELGAPVDMKDREFGSSPIAWAAHGSMNSRAGSESDYAIVTEMLIDAGATRAPSYNKWGEPPERLASPAVVRVLRQRGFTA